MKTTSIDSYVRSEMHSVGGYMRSADARIIASLLKYQVDNDIAGNLCEIGVHHGRLFLLLALARRNGERSVAIDLFEDDALNIGQTEHRGRDRALDKNARRFGITLSAKEIVKGSSLDLNPADILSHAGGQIRFFSIDGGHDYRCVANDLELAAQTISDGGIIAIDDFFNREWPGVSFAAYDYLRANDAVRPFLLSSGKLFVARPAMVEQYQYAARAANADMHHSLVEFMGREIPYLRYGYSRLLTDHLSDRLAQTMLKLGLRW